MAGLFPIGEMALDQKAGESKRHPFAAEAWLEPWLCKNDFYRNHFTRDGRRESRLRDADPSSLKPSSHERTLSSAVAAEREVHAATTPRKLSESEMPKKPEKKHIGGKGANDGWMPCLLWSMVNIEGVGWNVCWFDLGMMAVCVHIQRYFL
jgi:hypothetical protein